MTINQFISRAKDIAEGKTVYLYGGIGQPVTSILINAKAKQYPKWYTASRIKKLSCYIGYLGYDCSGLIKAICKDLNEPIKDMNADSIFSTMCIKTDDPAAGCLAHVKGHIGIVIDSDHVIEANSKKEKVCISDINERKWEFGKFTILKEDVTSIPAPAQPENPSNKYEQMLQDLQNIINKYKRS